jgi:V/A-type H+-transporting ATPase subunit K
MVEPGVALAAAIAIGATGIGAGLAEQVIGAAAVGVIAEDEKHFTKGLILTVIPETIVVFGFVIAIMLLFLN